MLFYYCVQCKLWFPLSTAAFVLMLLDRAHRKTSGSALMGTAYEEARLMRWPGKNSKRGCGEPAGTETPLL